MLRRARQVFANLGESGATAVEFGIVGVLFLMLLLAIFELGYMVFVQSMLDSSARSAARLIRTGQATGGNAQATFEANLCPPGGTISGIMGCGNIIYQVQDFPNWAGANTALTTPPTCTPPATCNPLSGSGAPVFNAGTCTTPGNPQIIAVQVAYNYKFFTLWIGQLLGGSTRSAYLMLTVVFQNEPYCSVG